MKTKIYAYYGILAHEKEPVYRTNKVDGEIREELMVEIPVPTWRNTRDEIGVTLDGEDYLLSMVLTNIGNAPALAWVDHYGKRHYMTLKVVAE